MIMLVLGVLKVRHGEVLRLTIKLLHKALHLCGKEGRVVNGSGHAEGSVLRSVQVTDEEIHQTLLFQFRKRCRLS